MLIQIPDAISILQWRTYYNESIQVVICKICRSGIRNPDLESHLRDAHPGILTLQQRNQLIQEFTSKPRVLKDWPLSSLVPSPEAPPISDIEWYQDNQTYRCRLCSKKKQENAKTPPAAVLIALNPLLAKSMPRGKKRKELASEADVESEEEHVNVECWLLFQILRYEIRC